MQARASPHWLKARSQVVVRVHTADRPEVPNLPQLSSTSQSSVTGAVDEPTGREVYVTRAKRLVRWMRCMRTPTENDSKETGLAETSAGATETAEPSARPDTRTSGGAESLQSPDGGAMTIV